MSASREKKKRQNPTPEEAVGAGKTKKGMNRTLKRVLIAVAAVVIIAAIVFLGMVSTGFFAKHSTAAVVGEHKLTPAEVSYFYSDAYQEYSQFFSYFVDTSVSLDEQAYPGEEYDTWADYLMTAALSNASSVYAIYDDAIASGYTLSESAASSIESQVQMLDMYATLYGYSNTDAYLTYVFGAGCTVDSYREHLTITSLAEEYRNSIYSGFTYSKDEIDTYYSAHTEDFDGVTFRVFSIDVDSTAEDTDAALAECEETAKTMAEVSQGSEDAFLAQCLKNTAEESREDYDADTSTLREDYVKASAAEAYRDWLFDAARQPGDATYVANGETGYYVVYFVENVDHTWLLPTVRHILVGVSDTTDEEAMAAAEAEAQEILDTFLSGDQTEDAFAALADEKSDDSSEGGLIEAIAPGVMVASFEEWAYDESRQVGDTGIVESSYGYHVMYFCGESDTSYQDYKVESTMRTNDYNQWFSDVTADASYTTNSFFMRFAA